MQDYVVMQDILRQLLSNTEYEHDGVIHHIQSELARLCPDHYFWSNPGSNKNMPVASGTAFVYPDIVVFSIVQNRIVCVIEVETQTSVSDFEARQQWKKYADTGCEFWLLVPASKWLDAIVHAAHANVNPLPKIGIWSHDGSTFSVTYPLP